MAEDKRITSPDAASVSAPGEVPLDTRILSEAVIELNISRKNVGIYPPGHIQITRSIDRAFEILLRLFEIRPVMTLGVAKDTLLVGHDYLDRNNPVYRDFALSMNQQGIAAVTFKSGLTRDELVAFHRVLTTRPEDIRNGGGIRKVMAEAAIGHIEIQPVNYGSFHVTEEQEITAPRTGGRAGSASPLWQDFVAHLSQGTLAGPGEGVSLADAEQIDPAELARLLNERRLDPSSAVQSYDRIISSHIRNTAERKHLTREQSRTLDALNGLLKDLNPELRKQFLSVAFERVSAASRPAAEEIMGGFADDMVIEMLEQANREGREISPTLAGLVGKLSAADRDADAVARAGEGSVSAALIEPEILTERMQKLFDREQYENFVSPEYEAMLKQMAQTAAPAAPDFPLEEHLKSLDEARLDFQIGRALIAFLEENLEEEDYREFANKLASIVPGFLETGNFELLWDISETLRRHSTDKPVKGIREAAGEARRIFTEPAFIEQALRAFETWMREKGQEAAGLIQSLGPGVIPGLLDIYSRDTSLGGRRVLFNLLCLFGDPAVLEAQKRLRDTRSYYVVNLLILIRRAGTPAAAPSVRPLAAHSDIGVRMEALSTLLKFKDPGSVRLLKEAIRSEDLDVSSRAVALAGLYRVSEAVDDVLARLKRVILFETDYAANSEVVKVLGRIGDPRAIPELEKLARANWSLYPQSLLAMKEVLFESLEGYPRESIGRLIGIGEQSASDRIKKACKKLSERP